MFGVFGPTQCGHDDATSRVEVEAGKGPVLCGPCWNEYKAAVEAYNATGLGKERVIAALHNSGLSKRETRWVIRHLPRNRRRLLSWVS